MILLMKDYRYLIYSLYNEVRLKPINVIIEKTNLVTFMEGPFELKSIQVALVINISTSAYATIFKV